MKSLKTKLDSTQQDLEVERIELNRVKRESAGHAIMERTLEVALKKQKAEHEEQTVKKKKWEGVRSKVSEGVRECFTVIQNHLISSSFPPISISISSKISIHIQAR